MTEKTPLICFRLSKTEKEQIQTMAKLQGISPSAIFQNYAKALLTGDAEVYPPRGEKVAYQ